MHSPLITISPNGKWLVFAGPDNTAIVRKIDYPTYEVFPNRILMNFETHEQGRFYGHQKGLHGNIFGTLYEGTWNGDGDELTTTSTDGSRMRWNVPHCILLEEYAGNTP